MSATEETPDNIEPVFDLGPEAIDEARRAIEAIVMVADEPADPRMLAQLIEISSALVDQICADLAREYDESGRGFELVKVAGGWRFQSRGELSPYVERFVLAGQSSRLSAAALETLSIVAYKQPISRAQVAAIRGVSVDGVMRTLQQRGYIAELARDPGPGQAVLFGTTSLFLERMGLNALDELPSLGEFVPGADVVESDDDPVDVAPAESATAAVDVAADVAADVEVVIDLTEQIEPTEPTEQFEAIETIDLTETIDLSGLTGATGDMELDALDVLSDDSPS